MTLFSCIYLCSMFHLILVVHFNIKFFKKYPRNCFLVRLGFDVITLHTNRCRRFQAFKFSHNNQVVRVHHKFFLFAIWLTGDLHRLRGNFESDSSSSGEKSRLRIQISRVLECEKADGESSVGSLRC